MQFSSPWALTILSLALLSDPSGAQIVTVGRQYPIPGSTQGGASPGSVIGRQHAGSGSTQGGTSSGSVGGGVPGDMDSDGLSDDIETAGWTIVIDEQGYGPIASGSFMTILKVYSDPNKVDTDGDGLSDLEEYVIGTNPANPDTDGDILTDSDEWYQWFTNPNSVDSDGDARGPDQNLPPDPLMFDIVELHPGTPVTSPTLVDTDGDGRWDSEEVAHPLFHPLIAELPESRIETIGDATILLNVEYSESVGQSTDYGTSFTKSSSAGYQYGSSTSDSISASIKSTTTITGGAKLVPPSLGGMGSEAIEIGGGYESVWESSYGTSQSTEAGEEYSQYQSDSSQMTETSATGDIRVPVRLTNTGDFTFTLNNLSMTVLKWTPPVTDPNQDPLAFDPELTLEGKFDVMGTLTPSFGGLTLAPGESTPLLEVAAVNVNADTIKDFLANPSSFVLSAAVVDLVSADGIDFDFITETTYSQTALIEINLGGGQIDTYRVATNVNRAGFQYLGISLREAFTEILGIKEDLSDQGGAGLFTLEEVVITSPGSTAPVKTGINVIASLNGKSYKEGASPGDPPLAFWTISGSNIDPDEFDLDADGKIDATVVDFDEIQLFAGDVVRIYYSRDDDQDGLFEYEEEFFGTSDQKEDSDGDGLLDFDEIKKGLVVPDSGYIGHLGYPKLVYPNARLADSDLDGLDDGMEASMGTDPTQFDTDQDGLNDLDDPAPLIPARRFYAMPGGLAGTYDNWLDAGDLYLVLQEAEKVNGNGDPTDDVSEVWVQRGSYSTTSDPNDSFYLPADVAVYGGFFGSEVKLGGRDPDPFTNATVLTGDIGMPYVTTDNSYRIVQVDTGDTGAVLDGFTITGSGGSGSPVPITGGGLYVSSNAEVTLRNVLFFNNHAEHGGGLYVSGEATVENCTFLYNTAVSNGGAIVDLLGRLQMSDSTVSDNSSDLDGGGIASGWTAAIGKNGPTLLRCVISGNHARGGSGGIIGNGGGGWVTAGGGAESCDFYGNSAGETGTFGLGGAIRLMGDYQPSAGGLGLTYDLGLRLVNCRIFDNSANSGGGLATLKPGMTAGAAAGIVKVTNCTIAYNNGLSTSAGLYAFGGNLGTDTYPLLVLDNSILAGNSVTTGTPGHISQQIYWGTDALNAIASVNFNLIEAVSDYPGIANLKVSPEFVDGVGGDLRLANDSPCIDAGWNAVDINPLLPGIQFLPPVDLDGAPRLVGILNPSQAKVDLGAYELQVLATGTNP